VLRNNDHGLIHAAKVCVLCAVLAKKLGLDQDSALRLMFAAVAHDTGRKGNSADAKHGERSVASLEKAIDSQTIAIVANHSKADRSVKDISVETKILTHIFKDADALDRARTGDLDEKYLRFEQSKKLIEFARELNRCLLTVQD